MSEHKTQREDGCDDTVQSAAITVLALPVGSSRTLSLRAWQALNGADHVLVASDTVPWIAQIAPAQKICNVDDLAGSAVNAPDLSTLLVHRVVGWASSEQSVVYVTPDADGIDGVVMALNVAANRAGLTFEIVGEADLVDSICGALVHDRRDGVQIVDAARLSRDHHPRVEVGLALLCESVSSRELASSLKATLLNAYPLNHEVSLVHTNSGRPVVHRAPLHRLDELTGFDRSSYLLVPPLPQNSSLSDLQELVAHLRAPEGCPWDREQTLASLRQDLLSECVEVLEAIDLEDGGRDNGVHIAEELGDLLMLVMMLVQIGTDTGRFQMSDVVHGIVTKLIRRHPHVFDRVTVDDVDQVFANWDEIKAQEKAEKGIEQGPLDGVPSELPALEKARRLQSKAAKAGLFDRQRAAERQPALAEQLAKTPAAEDLGQLLWDLVALAHGHDLNAENALRSYAVRYREMGEMP